MKECIKKVVLVAILAVASNLFVNAQPQDGDPDGDPDLIPLDPGSWVLVAAGVGYGMKKWKDARSTSGKNGQVDPGAASENDTTDNR